MPLPCLNGPKSAPNSGQGKTKNFRLVKNGENTADAYFSQSRHRTENEEHVKHPMPDAVKVGTELIAEVD